MKDKIQTTKKTPSNEKREENNQDEEIDTTESKGRRVQPDSEVTDGKIAKNQDDPKPKTKKKTV